MQLIRYEKARQAIAECKRVDEAKRIRDHAEAVRAYAHVAKDRTIEKDAQEIRLRAERRLGELLAAQKALPRDQGGGLNKGTAGRLPGRGKATAVAVNDRRGVDPTPTLDELGISKDLSARAQRLAALSASRFDEVIVEARARVDRIAPPLPRKESPEPDSDSGALLKKTHASYDVSCLANRRPWDEREVRTRVCGWLTVCLEDWWKGQPAAFLAMVREHVESLAVREDIEL